MRASARIQVAIVEEAAAYRRGLEAALEAAGMAVAQPDDLRSWAADSDRRAVLFSVRSQADLDKLGATVAESTVVIVALLTSLDNGEVADALRAGASGVVDWHAPPESIVEITQAALEGKTVLPATVARALAGSSTHRNHKPRLSAEELSWLTALANGTTVVKLADDAGYSERAMFRRLSDLYARLGAHNRTEALLAADRLGLLQITS